MKERSRLAIHAILLLGAVCTYLVEPEDVVWQFVRGASNARALERICFTIAAVMLAISLWLRVRLDDSEREQDRARWRTIASDFLQAIGIGSLMPLAGFLLLVIGETAVSAVRSGSERGRPDTGREGLSRHAGLFLAFLSMVVFSITLSDRLAEYLFAGSALVTMLANFAPVLARRR